MLGPLVPGRLSAGLFAALAATVLCATVLCASLARAQAGPEAPGGLPIPLEEEVTGERTSDALDETQRSWSEQVLSTATWMDAFFDDGLYKTTSNKTYLRFSLKPSYDHRGVQFKVDTDLRLQLPNTERWLLNVGGSPDQGTLSGSTTLEEEERNTDRSDKANAYAGLSTFFQHTETRNVSTGGGIKLSTSRLALYGTFSWVELWPFKHWDLRATQRFRIYTDEPAEFKSRLDADWPLSHRFLFRSTGAVLFRVDNPDTSYDLDLTLFQYLTTRRALMYRLRNGFVTSTHTPFQLNRVAAEVEYRRQWRDWFYASLIPQLVFEDQRDWRADPGIRLNFSFRFGYTPEVTNASPYAGKQRADDQRNRAERERNLREGQARIQRWMLEQEESGEPAP
ncbi:hypothetical protein DND132_2100 [Pseudodesulfovibrio mercurii]|uniref:Uncharacterized protein n=1 Tax=Pseudodesulfovibrio mercurii TaxID=641491 RepID=F0JHR9_9BACT|nr:hypothetical protein [Pseudodesulfovibrio mercurii]EGB15305.1 hypothetical protein DND132_2100 [Pseudodesulfovibrio mercurii]